MSGVLIRSLTAACLGVALVQPIRGHVDILVAAKDGQTVTGETDFFSSSVGQRAFGGDVMPYSTGYYAMTSPGFGALGRDELLPAGIDRLPGYAELSYDITVLALPKSTLARNAWYWSGQGEMRFDVLPAGHRLVVESTVDFALADGGSEIVPGHRITTASSTGAMHQHIGFGIDGPEDNDPNDGLYVIPLTLKVTGLADADTIVVVLNKGLPPATRYDAVQALQDVLVPPADFDGDGDVDLSDQATLTNCLTGPGIVGQATCGDCDLDGDLDVDLHDFQQFQLSFTGATVMVMN